MIEEKRDLFYKQLMDLLEEDQDPLKEGARKRFEMIGLPTKKTGPFQYLNLFKLYDTPVEKKVSTPTLTKEDILPNVLKECQGAYLVFVNGCFSQNLSDLSKVKKISVSPFSQAMFTFGSFLTQKNKRLIKEETDPFVLFNQSIAKNGAFLYLPPKVVVETPLQVLFISSEEANTWLTPQLSIFASAHTALDIIVTQDAKNSSCSINQLIDFSIEENAHVNLIQTTHSKSFKGWHFDAVRATLKRDGTFKSYLAGAPGETYRADYKVSLTQENAEAKLNGIFVLEKNAEAHTHVLIDHEAPNCTSSQLFKIVLKDTSRSSFEGKILVRKEAQKTNAYQLNQNLLLGTHAQSYSKPNLEIFADDVKASHGATIGQLKEEDLFYLKSRGISEEDAKQLLVKGFMQEVLDTFPLDFFHDRPFPS